MLIFGDSMQKTLTLVVSAIAFLSPLFTFKPASALGIYSYLVSCVSDPYTYDQQNNSNFTAVRSLIL